MPFKSIIFDMGDIFYDATIWRKWLTDHLQNLGLNVDYFTLCNKWEAHLVNVYLGKSDYWSNFRQLLEEFGLDSKEQIDTESASKVKASEIERRTLFEGVKETLSELKLKNILLAVLSDTESKEKTVRLRLAELAIEQYFCAVVTSIDIGFVKPQPEAFNFTLAKLNSEPKQTIFVGHDEDELKGAMHCGLTSVAYNYRDGVIADYYIHDFRQLLSLFD